MRTAEILRAWGKILVGRTPSLSIEITRECPLRCPGCYAFGSDHLGGIQVLKQVRDFKGQELIDGIMNLVNTHKPLHVSLVGGEPLVRFRELNMLLPILSARGIHTQVVTSAVRPIPPEWSRIRNLNIAVSIDGLQPEHDARRKPATYDRIQKHIEGHRITVHCTITRQMTLRPGYLREFMEFWSAKEEVWRIWVSLYTPQVGEASFEILPPKARHAVIDDLLQLRLDFPKLDMPPSYLQVFHNPPKDPSECIFSRTTKSITADLKRAITPCQFGGKPDCSQCGCLASAGMAAAARHRLPFGIDVAALYEISYKVGQHIAGLRKPPRDPEDLTKEGWNPAAG